MIVADREAELDALGTAIALLDSEEVRYTQRFVECPNGCTYDYADAVMVKGEVKPWPSGEAALVQVTGPDDCTLCADGTVEDAEAGHLTPMVEVLRELLARLEAQAS